MKTKMIKGASLIEFALVAPIALLIFVGIIEFGVMFYDKAVITNASREGARYGVVIREPTYATSTQIAAYVQSYCSNRLVTFGSSTSVTTTCTFSATPQKFGDKLTVKVDYVYTGLVLFKFIATTQTKTLSATTVMTYE